MPDQIISPVSPITMVSETISWPFLSSLIDDATTTPQAIKVQESRIKKILAQDKAVTNTQADQIQLYWHLAWPIQELIDVEETSDNSYFKEGPYWLHIPHNVSPDVQHDNLGLNMWCREIYAAGVSFLVPKLKQSPMLNTMFLINLYPVIASSTQTNYDRLKDTVLPYPLLGKIPLGLALDDTLVHEVVHGNTPQAATN